MKNILIKHEIGDLLKCSELVDECIEGWIEDDIFSTSSRSNVLLKNNEIFIFLEESKQNQSPAHSLYKIITPTGMCWIQRIFVVSLANK